MVVNYELGKIYVLRSHQTDDIYVGSTAQKLLSTRLGGHKRNYNDWVNGKHNYISSYEILKYDDCYIELLEDYPCENKHQLCKKEGEYIRKMDCINKHISGRTKKEYYKDNKEQTLERVKQYYNNNREKISEYKKKHTQINREKISEYQKKWRKENKEHKSKTDSEYYQKTKINRQQKNECICGCIISKGWLPEHKKSKKHIDYMNSQKK